MSCPKCRGFVGCDCGEARCFNCGWRPGDGRRVLGDPSERRGQALKKGAYQTRRVLPVEQFTEERRGHEL